MLKIETELPKPDVISWKERCYRCSGDGVLPWFMHVKQGVCFRCGGTTVIECRRRRDQWYWAGYFAYCAGLENWDCPFGGTSWAFKSWQFGFEDALQAEAECNVYLSAE